MAQPFFQFYIYVTGKMDPLGEFYISAGALKGRGPLIFRQTLNGKMIENFIYILEQKFFPIFLLFQ